MILSQKDQTPKTADLLTKIQTKKEYLSPSKKDIKLKVNTFHLLVALSNQGEKQLNKNFHPMTKESTEKKKS